MSNTADYIAQKMQDYGVGAYRVITHRKRIAATGALAEVHSTRGYLFVSEVRIDTSISTLTLVSHGAAVEVTQDEQMLLPKSGLWRYEPMAGQLAILTNGAGVVWLDLIEALPTN